MWEGNEEADAVAKRGAKLGRSVDQIVRRWQGRRDTIAAWQDSMLDIAVQHNKKF